MKNVTPDNPNESFAEHMRKEALRFQQECERKTTLAQDLGRLFEHYFEAAVVFFGMFVLPIIGIVILIRTYH